MRLLAFMLLGRRAGLGWLGGICRQFQSGQDGERIVRINRATTPCIRAGWGSGKAATLLVAMGRTATFWPLKPTLSRRTIAIPALTLSGPSQIIARGAGFTGWYRTCGLALWTRVRDTIWIAALKWPLIPKRWPYTLATP
jgi:hypothetical protein